MGVADMKRSNSIRVIETNSEEEESWKRRWNKGVKQDDVTPSHALQVHSLA